ncbi:MAG TPA: zinc-binding dehydrogenase [Thermoanaerobaculia bacterium]|nr:zinc-binding dehydrogenase [Thermoanaerobaculia bacterium]
MRAGLALLGELTGKSEIRPVVDRRYPLAETGSAIAHVGAGRARGKVVVAIR